MRHLLRVFSVLAIMAMLGTVMPAGAFAQISCTDQYAACINESGQLAGTLTPMGDDECAAEYVGCVARKLKFW